MAWALKKTVSSVEEYLEFERASEERHEYIDGVILMMAGESDAHADICANIVGELRARLKGTPCRVRTKDTKVRSGFVSPKRLTKGMISYPDILVICGAVEHHDKHKHVVTNPTVIMEVLSDSTEEFDRIEKFRRYRDWNPTLVDYVLVSQDAPFVEHHTKQPDGGWTRYEHRGVEASFNIASINCELQLVEIYDRIEFPPDEFEEFNAPQ